MDDCFEERLVYSDSDGSEVDEPIVSNSTEPTTQLSEENSTPLEHTNAVLASNDHISSEESDNDDLIKSIKKTKKNTRILSSDDEQQKSDDESHSKSDNVQLSDNESMEAQSKVPVRPSICDSDTKSSDDEKKDGEDIQPMKSMKKVKKKKNKLHRRLLAVGDTSDSESNDENDGKPVKKQKKLAKRKNVSDHSGSSNSSKSGSGSGSGSASDSNSSSHSNHENADKTSAPREKTAQRMSAKMAEQQMKEIQSESQRLARQLHVSIPYHRPKQHSLKEFLSRRSIVEHQEKLNSKPMPKAAVAIKMSGEELIQFMEHMDKRTKEAEEFFQDEEEDDTNKLVDKSDGSEDEDWTDKAKVVEEKPIESINEVVEPQNAQGPETQMEVDAPEVDSMSSTPVTNEAIEQIIEEVSTIESNEMPPAETPDIIELRTEPTELDVEIDAMLRKEARVEKLKLCIPTDHVPKLKGDKGFVIDLETNDLKPMPQSGVDELLNRFMKNACVKSTASEQHDVGTLNENASVELHKFNVNLDDKPKREPKPGESLFKLRSELSQKIRENREKLIAQRLREEKEQKLLDSEEEELCDEEEDGKELSETEEPNEGNELLDLEAADEEGQLETNDECNVEEANSEDEDEDEDEASDQDDADAADDLDVTDVVKPRKRIIAMDDSDDESAEPTPISVAPIRTELTESVTQQPGHQSADQSFDEPSKAMTSHDLSALESEILQLDSQTNTGQADDLNKSETSKLFQDGNYGDISESQLMDLCSGVFVTQFPENPKNCDAQSTQIGINKPVEATQVQDDEQNIQEKPAFLSSDEEETETDATSDDEEDAEQTNATGERDEEAEEEQIEDEEEDIGERYIEYDSDKNEIEVELKKSDVKKKASEYVENEAELSESEWGSADEDEKDELNHYEAELGDLEKFDKNKLRDELERIRLREQIDDDARAIRILTERFVEEEDNGMERERKFRWKHLNNGENDDQVQNVDQDTTEQNNSDDENEAEWRRIRYEREQLLKQQVKDGETANERTSVAMESVTEQKSIENVTSIFNNTRRLSIIKPISNPTSRTSSPFLITKCDLSVSHLSRKSFLNRDSPILEKLASLSKVGTDGETISNTAKGKGNYVFVATEKKDNSKRKSESEHGAIEPGANHPSKKSKIDIQK